MLSAVVFFAKLLRMWLHFPLSSKVLKGWTACTSSFFMSRSVFFLTSTRWQICSFCFILYCIIFDTLCCYTFYNCCSWILTSFCCKENIILPWKLDKSANLLSVTLINLCVYLSFDNIFLLCYLFYHWRHWISVNDTCISIPFCL